MPVSRSDGSVAVLRVSVPITSIKTVIGKVRDNIFIGGIIIALIIAALSWIFSRQVSRPLEEMGKGAEEIARGDFDVRIAGHGSLETRALAGTLNRMSGDLKQKINTIQKQQSEMDAVFSSMQEAVIAVDRDHNIMLVNPSAIRLLNIDGDSVKGKNLLNLVRNTRLHGFLSDVLSGREEIEEELKLKEDHQERIIRAGGTQLKSASGETAGALIVMNDITRTRKLETMRRDFVANVSHELKTPIASIMGAAETLKDGAMEHPADAEKFVNMVRTNGERVNRIVTDLLSLSQIEQQTEQPDRTFESFQVRGIINEAAQACELKSAERQVEIIQQVPKDLRAPMDSQLMEQAIVNLLDNAIKYSDKGTRVTVSAEEKAGMCHIHVADEGMGIPEAHLPRLFERFYRVDRARSRKLGGTGLGLAIVKHITQLHGGHVSVKSRVKEGSIFTIHLPCS
ncbi:ATP-binding protein [Fibrobacterota bacterium]